MKPKAPESLLSFIDEDVPQNNYAVVDRSTLQAYATCPAQGVALEGGELLNDNAAMASGNEVHAALSQAVKTYIAAGLNFTKGELRQELENELLGARPDVQPEAMRAASPTTWAWSEFIAKRHPNDILRFDGGKGERSGQLAMDLDSLKLRVTSEVDLLLATPSPEVLDSYDYKSGQKWWTERDVFDAFQFQLHAMLIWHNYPEVKMVRSHVWSTRFNTVTYAAEYIREKHQRQFEARLRSVCGYYAQHSPAVPFGYSGTPPVWPGVDKCPTCPAAAKCPAAKHAGEIAADPRKYVASMYALSQQLDAMEKTAKAYVDEHGDIIGDGFAFGRGKPPAVKKPTAKLYTIKSDEE